MEVQSMNFQRDDNDELKLLNLKAPPQSKSQLEVTSSRVSEGPSHVLMNFSYVASSSSSETAKRAADPSSASTSTSKKQMLTSASPSTLNRPSSSSSSSISMSRQRSIRLDPRIERDYIHKRKKAYEESSSTPSLSANNNNDKSNTFVTIWDGVSKVERELVECCERLQEVQEEEDEVSNNDENENEEEEIIEVDESSEVTTSTTTKVLGGVLAVEKEVRFAAILARSCHTMGSKSLALAILERSLKAYLAEEKSNEINDEEEDNNEDAVEDDKTVGLGNNDDNNNNDDDRNNNKKTNVKPSQQHARYQNRIKRLKLDENGKSIHCLASSNEISGNSGVEIRDNPNSSCGKLQTSRRRFGRFFAAGGLKILNQWLIDASAYDMIVVTAAPNPSTSSTRKNANAELTTTKRKASTTRPIILTILHFLENIPFEKKTVMNSKINKQIQKLGKKVMAIKEAQKDGQASKEDLDNWTTDKSITDVMALSQIQTAVDTVKKSWREKATEKAQEEQISQSSNSDPFQSLRSKIHKRLIEYETDIPVIEPAISTAKKEESHTSPNLATAKRKIMEENKSPDHDKLILRKKIKHAQSRSKKSLQELREKLRKRKVENGISPVDSLQGKIGNNTKRVVWKDGLKSHLKRNRQMLEEVFVFTKELPSAELGVVPDSGSEKG